MRRAARVDENQGAIVAELRDHGCTVQSLASIGKGCPDLLVGYLGLNILFEVKNPMVARNKQRLTPDEQAWRDKWTGQLATVRTPFEATQFVDAVARAFK